MKIAQAVALAHDLGEQRVEPVLAAALQHRGESLAQPGIAGHRARSAFRAARSANSVSSICGSSISKCAGDVGLQRKLVQHRFAEGVDGLDLQPARRLQRLGEQPSRAAELFGVGLPAFDRCDLFASSASPSIVQSDRLENTRFDMLAAAARV